MGTALRELVEEGHNITLTLRGGSTQPIMGDQPENSPVLHHPTDEVSVFLPQNLLDRAAEMLDRQRGTLPDCCMLDGDAELVPVAMERFGAAPSSAWPCFHTTLLLLERDGMEMSATAVKA